MRFDPIPFSHPLYRHPLRHGSVQHGLPAAMRIGADSGLGDAADKRNLLAIMKDPLSVNEVLDHLAELAGEDVHVTGILSFEFENVAIHHHPKSELRDDYQSSIWLSTGIGSLGFDERVCERLNGRRVNVRGKLLGPDAHLGGCGHMSLWPAELLVRTLERA